MGKIPIMVVGNEDETTVKSELMDENDFSVKFIEGPENFEVLYAALKEIFSSTDVTHVMVIYDQKIVTRRFMKHVKYAATRIEFVDFYQIAGGRVTLGLFRNLLHNIRMVIAIKVVLKTPLPVLKFLKKIFLYFPLKSSTKNKILSALIRNFKDINRFNSENIYLSSVLNWNNARVPLKAFFVSEVWLNALAHLHKKPLLTFERSNVALARSGNMISTSKLYLF